MIKFEDIDIMPGVVIKNDDPKRIGRIKVSVPLWFTLKTMHINAINWVYPMCMLRFQSFSKMELGRTVWVLHEKTNYYDFQYIPMFELNADLKEILTRSYNNTEVIFSRQKGEVTSQLYYNDEEGIVAKYANTSIVVSSENDIIATDGKASIALKGSTVHLGTDGPDGEGAVLGNTLQDTLLNLSNNLFKFASELSPSPYLTKAQETLYNATEQFNDELNNILSESVKIYK